MQSSAQSDIFSWGLSCIQKPRGAGPSSIMYCTVTFTIISCFWCWNELEWLQSTTRRCDISKPADLNSHMAGAESQPPWRPWRPLPYSPTCGKPGSPSARETLRFVTCAQDLPMSRLPRTLCRDASSHTCGPESSLAVRTSPLRDGLNFSRITLSGPEGGESYPVLPPFFNKKQGNVCAWPFKRQGSVCVWPFKGNS